VNWTVNWTVNPPVNPPVNPAVDSSLTRRAAAVALSALLAACQPEAGVPVPVDPNRGAAPTLEPAAPSLKRLTGAQYRNAMTSLFGDEILLPTGLEADQRIEGLFAVGSAHTTVSSRGVEKYESGAYSVAGQMMDLPAARDLWVTCEPVDTRDDDCAETVLAALGRRAWRRPVEPDELNVLVAVAGESATALDDFHEGLEFGVAAVLMSPYFLYRAELGDGPSAPDGAYDDWEMASRLSFFLWNTLPDAELLEAAEAGELTTEAGLSAQVDRMLDDARAVDGVRNFFSEMFHLDKLDELSKDPELFVHMRDELGDAAREETLLGIETLVFDDDGDYRDLYTSRRAWIDRSLAAIYDVPAPSRDGFGEVTLDASGGRRGLTGQVSFLALNAHAVSTSATRRGIFVREVVLCQNIPDPPSDANTAIPEVSEDAPTMRERIAVHLEDPYCAGCHLLTDPIGLGFENFDGIGRFRTLENEATIDPSGDIDGTNFSDAWSLAGVLAKHPATVSCLPQTLMQYATGSLSNELDGDLMDWHEHGFVDAGHRVRWLMADIARSPGFSRVGEVQ
jgi:hypothetical protein